MWCCCCTMLINGKALCWPEFSRHSSCRPGDPSGPGEGSPCSEAAKTPSPPPTTQMTAPNNLSASMTNVPTNPTTTMLAKPVDQPEADMSTVAVGTNWWGKGQWGPNHCNNLALSLVPNLHDFYISILGPPLPPRYKQKLISKLQSEWGLWGHFVLRCKGEKW